MSLVPKKERVDEPGRTRSIWASDVLWSELEVAAKREGYSTSKFVGFLLRGALSLYEAERAAEKNRKP